MPYIELMLYIKFLLFSSSDEDNPESHDGVDDDRMGVLNMEVLILVWIILFSCLKHFSQI